MKYHFSGYATKNDIRCKDGRIIKRDAFKGNDGMKVPLVWQHMHDSADNILGHVFLENREDGVYCKGVLNNTAGGENAKKLLRNGDIDALSIYANSLIEKNKNVLHGEIKEVSLVLAGANPEAKIDYVNLIHADGMEEVSDDEAIIMTGLRFEDVPDSALKHKEVEEEDEDEDGGKKVKGKPETLGDAFKDVMDSLDADDQEVVLSVIANALEHDDLDEGEEIGEDLDGFEELMDSLPEDKQEAILDIIEDALEQSELAGSEDEHFTHSEEDLGIMRNVFENYNGADDQNGTLSHADMVELMADVRKSRGTMKEALLQHAEEYGIEDIDVLFPDAKNLDGTSQFIQRDNEWVGKVLDGAVHSPISRIKTIIADITEDEARAKGYVTGSEKFEEVFPVFARTTTPTTIYKKQKLDRDDIVDIDWDVVAWMRAEMVVMLKEELARAILIGDGRVASHKDKINEQNIRPIATDDAIYTTKVILDEDISAADMAEAIIRGKKHYKGGGQPTFFTGIDLMTDILLIKEEVGSNKKLYNGAVDAAAQLRVKEFVEVEQLDNVTTTIKDKDGENVNVKLLGIMVNMKNYTIGATKGGEITTFEDFDIDFNQNKYLIETRCAGMLRVPKSAVAFYKKVTPETPVVPGDDDGGENEG